MQICVVYIYTVDMFRNRVFHSDYYLMLSCLVLIIISVVFLLGVEFYVIYMQFLVFHFKQ